MYVNIPPYNDPFAAGALLLLANLREKKRPSPAAAAEECLSAIYPELLARQRGVT
jgi:hypothetical protein